VHTVSIHRVFFREEAGQLREPQRNKLKAELIKVFPSSSYDLNNPWRIEYTTEDPFSVHHKLINCLETAKKAPDDWFEQEVEAERAKRRAQEEENDNW